MAIPTIDLSRATDQTRSPQLLKDVRHALVDVGFLYLSNHGIEESTIDDLVKMLPVLFALPEDVKESAALRQSPHFLGFSKFGTEITARVQDQREQFELANELEDKYSKASGLPLYTRLQGPNQWLKADALPEFREIVESYIAALQDVALRFLEVVTESLELPQDSLVRFTGPQDRLKLVHYRPSADATLDAQSQGVGPHKDSSGWMTFLLQASDPSIKGLQALSKDGVWLDVTPVPGTLIVNMGQAFEVVTNGVCKATTHRVLLPPGDYDRYSVPFFQGVRPDLTKRDLQSLWGHFDKEKWNTRESEEGQRVDSPFLRGKYETWGEAQLRTKIRSHRDVGLRHYADVFEKYVNDD
ncbi:naringenin 3-dioxygenase [Exophiala viscosa]|uniref:naringenin 3-dioxygenase n=1 Tax=Exophiala viscosa TaxID=2486360 RepID=UPI002198AE84|nr:naringenin 3-dioxygenase [Exophiala viscosa]